MDAARRVFTRFSVPLLIDARDDRVASNAEDMVAATCARQAEIQIRKQTLP